MKFNNLCLHSFSYVEPPLFMSSEDIESKLSALYERAKLPFGRLEMQTGIKRRGLWPRGTRPSSIAAEAAKNIIENYPKENIDLLIHASVCRDFLEPATAAVVHQKLGLSSHCMISDVSNACLGVLSAILMAGQMIENKAIRSALIVSGEHSTPLLEETIHFLKNDPSMSRKKIKPFMASLTIGSAGVALLLTHSEESPGSTKILGGSTLTNSDAVELCQGDVAQNDQGISGLMMQTDSETLMKEGILLAQKNWRLTQDILGADFRVDKIIPHQVGVAHRLSLLQELSLPLDKDFETFKNYGNTGSAALPLTLMKAAESDFLSTGDHIALLGIGSGLTSTMLGLEWRNY